MCSMGEPACCVSFCYSPWWNCLLDIQCVLEVSFPALQKLLIPAWNTEWIRADFFNEDNMLEHISALFDSILSANFSHRERINFKTKICLNYYLHVQKVLGALLFGEMLCLSGWRTYSTVRWKEVLPWNTSVLYLRFFWRYSDYKYCSLCKKKVFFKSTASLKMQCLGRQMQKLKARRA